jgi:hypothetical protein
VNYNFKYVKKKRRPNTLFSRLASVLPTKHMRPCGPLVQGNLLYGVGFAD